MALIATDSTLSALTSGTSQLQVQSLPIPISFEIPFIQIFRPQQVYSLPIKSGTIKNLLAPYETAKFVSLDFSVEITGQTGKLQFATTIYGSHPAREDSWLGATVYQRFTGNAHGDTYAEYHFPSQHPFGTELKAIALGNDPPNFWFRFLGSSGDSCSIRGKIVVQPGGRGIIQATPLTEQAQSKDASKSVLTPPASR